MLLNSMNATELSVDAWSLNKLRLEPSDKWLDEYFDESEAKLPRFSLQVCRLRWLCTLWCCSNSYWCDWCTLVIEHRW